MKLLPAAAAAFASLLFAAGVVYLHATEVDVAPGTCRAPATQMARLDLVFGTARRTGEAVTDAEWRRFVDTDITSRFPAGFTVVDGDGQWRNERGIIEKERVHVLVLWHERNASLEDNVETLRAAYKAQFAQSSVMRVDGSSCVSF